MSLQQGMERKKVIQHIRGLYKIDLSASRHWQELVQQLTHDRWASEGRTAPHGSAQHSCEIINNIVVLALKWPQALRV